MMSSLFSRFFRRDSRQSSIASRVPQLEAMEPRMFLSAAPTELHPAGLHHAALAAQHASHHVAHAAHVKPNLIRESPAGSATYNGYGLTPRIIRTAYDFGTTGNEGAGQTIAIVDAYDDPNIAKDLANFDSNFAITGTNTNAKGSTGSVYNFFSKVNQNGGAALPTANGGWAQEISLDVEWAHAMAPAANILLVESSSNSTANLMAAVNYAATKASVVSMSWGSSEFSGESGYDPSFAKAGVTFVASAGDTGGQQEWPAESPNVIGVGGTTLSNSNGNYVSETGWSNSGGGTSSQENAPSYQSGLSYGGHRSSPDVGYDADPYSGFAVYDSYRYQGQAGWMDFGGTSAGAPQWAALIATADQQRAATPQAGGTSDKLPLNSIADTSSANYAQSVQAAIYSMYFNNTAYSNNDFHDISSGSAGGSTAAPGYDQVTGIGSPFAQNLIADLIADVT